MLQILFAFYLAVTLWLYFSREVIRTDVNFVLQRWYSQSMRALGGLQDQWQNRKRRRIRYYEDEDDYSYRDRYIDRR